MGRPPRLDRRVQFDERSRAFPIRALVGDRPRRGYTWRGDDEWYPGEHQLPLLDQCPRHGRCGGGCVGFGWALELAARPVYRCTSTQ